MYCCPRGQERGGKLWLRHLIIQLTEHPTVLRKQSSRLSPPYFFCKYSRHNLMLMMFYWHRLMVLSQFIRNVPFVTCIFSQNSFFILCTCFFLSVFLLTMYIVHPPPPLVLVDILLKLSTDGVCLSFVKFKWAAVRVQASFLYNPLIQSKFLFFSSTRCTCHINTLYR